MKKQILFDNSHSTTPPPPPKKKKKKQMDNQIHIFKIDNKWGIEAVIILVNYNYLHCSVI